MVAPSTMSPLLFTLLVCQCYGSMLFGPLINDYPCPRLKECNLSCARGYEKNILNCEICKCQSKSACEGLKCPEGQHCVPSYKIHWLVFKIPHCVNDEPDTMREISPSTTTTTTTTTVAPVVPRSRVCQYGERVSDCGINKPCEDPSKYKCVIYSPLGFGDCCLKEPDEPTPTLPPSGEMPRCMQVADIGPCRGMIPRYYYNVQSGECQKFNYGGCMENENNFVTMEECKTTCEKPCMMTPSAGRCRAAIVRYFYNSTKGECQRFTFGGCQGNGNNWRTLEECRQMCDQSASDGRYYIGKNEVDESNKP